MLSITVFFHKDTDFPAEAEYSDFSTDFSLKIFLWIFKVYSVGHFLFSNIFSVWVSSLLMPAGLKVWYDKHNFLHQTSDLCCF